MKLSLDWLVFLAFIPFGAALFPSPDHIRGRREVALASYDCVTTQASVAESTTLNLSALLQACLAEPLTSGQLTFVRVLMYVSSGWVAAWCVLSCVVNAVFNVYSMQRNLEIYQECGFTVLFVFLGTFTYQTSSAELCTATQIIVLFFVNLTCSVFVVKIFLSTCLIRNSIKQLTAFHWSFGFVFPLAAAAMATIGGYFSCSDFFGLRTLHCFAHTGTKQLWAYVLPSWLLFLGLCCINLYSFTMCKLTQLEDVNLTQLYWSCKTCKVTSLVFVFTLTAYLALMFAVDTQLLWLHCVYFAAALLLGPIVFIAHTFTHAQTCVSLFALTSLVFYKPCPPPLPTKHEEQFGVMFSLRIKRNFKTSPTSAASNHYPNKVQTTGNIMEQMLIVETPPLLKAKCSKKYLNKTLNIASVPQLLTGHSKISSSFNSHHRTGNNT